MFEYTVFFMVDAQNVIKLSQQIWVSEMMFHHKMIFFEMGKCYVLVGQVKQLKELNVTTKK